MPIVVPGGGPGGGHASWSPPPSGSGPGEADTRGELRVGPAGAHRRSTGRGAGWAASTSCTQHCVVRHNRWASLNLDPRLCATAPRATQSGSEGQIKHPRGVERSRLRADPGRCPPAKGRRHRRRCAGPLRSYRWRARLPSAEGPYSRPTGAAWFADRGGGAPAAVGREIAAKGAPLPFSTVSTAPLRDPIGCRAGRRRTNDQLRAPISSRSITSVTSVRSSRSRSSEDSVVSPSA